MNGKRKAAPQQERPFLLQDDIFLYFLLRHVPGKDFHEQMAVYPGQHCNPQEQPQRDAHKEVVGGEEKQKYWQQVDKKDQKGVGQMAQSHEHGVFQGVPEAVFKLGQHREGVGQKDEKEQGQKPESSHEKLSQGSIHGSANAHVQNQQESHGHEEESQADSLAEILPEGVEKHFPHIGIFLADNLQGRVIEGGGGGAYGDQGDAADEPQDIQEQQVCHPAHKSEKSVVHIKKAIHNVCPF